MPKSLNESIKSILSGEPVVKETVVKEDVTANSKTLAPKSKSFDGPKKLAGDEEVVIPDATPDPKKGTMNAGPKESALAKKDTSKSSKSPNPAEPMHKLAHQPQSPVNEEEIEYVDLDGFVAEMVEAGASEQEIHEALDEFFEEYEIVNEEEAVEAGDVSEEEVTEEEVTEGEEVTEEEETPVTEEEIVVDVTEDIKALFAGETLSEEFQAKAKLIFETVIKSKLVEHQKKLNEAFSAALAEGVEEINEKLSVKVEDYLNYVVEQWATDNEVAIETGLKSELTEDFISGLKNLFAEHYIDIPEEKVDVLEAQASKIEELQTKLNEEMENNVKLSKTINESNKIAVIASVVKGLPETQAAKIQELAATVDFTTEDEFKTKVTTLKENYFPKSGKVAKEVQADAPVILNETAPMNKYVNAIGRTIPSSARPIKE